MISICIRIQQISFSPFQEMFEHLELDSNYRELISGKREIGSNRINDRMTHDILSFRREKCVKLTAQKGNRRTLKLVSDEL